MEVKALEFASNRPLAGQMTPVPRHGSRSGGRPVKGHAKRKGGSRDGGCGILQ